MALFDRKNLLPVMTVGAQVLKQQAQPVLQVNDDIRAFAKDMIYAMREYDGIGLAAPQAGRSLRLVVLEVPGSDEEELSPGEAAMLPQMPMVLVNPRIIGKTTNVNSMWVILAITAIGGWLGILGMLIAIPLFSVVYMLLRRYVNARLIKRGLPINSDAYAGTFSVSNYRKAERPILKKYEKDRNTEDKEDAAE